MSFQNFIWFPLLNGKQLSYYQYFALLFSIISIVIAGINFLLYFSVAKLRTSKLNVKRDPFQSLSEFNGRLIYILRIKLQNIFLFSAYFFLGMVGVFCSGFGVLSNLWGMLIMLSSLTLFLVQIQVQAASDRIRQEDQTFYELSIYEKIKWLINDAWLSARKKFLVIFTVSLLVTLFFSRTCLDFYNDQGVYYNSQFGFGLNTQFTRWFTLKKACPPGPPCHIYATLAQDSQTQVFLNIQVNKKVGKLSLNIQPKANYSCMLVDYKGLEPLGQRNVFNCLVSGMQPDQLHHFDIYYQGKVQKSTTYKTISNDRELLRMANGGDSGYTNEARKITNLIGRLAPDILFMGGDLAYDNNIGHCYYTWDYFLNMLDQLNKQKGFLIPFVMGVGNHDVGLNQLPGTNITVNQYGPAYHIYFPQHLPGDYLLGKAQLRVPQLNQRRTYFDHRVGPLHYTCLDSGYLHQFGKEQEAYLRKALAKYPNLPKFVNYHVPLYSGCKTLARDANHFIYGTFHWIPNFDQFKVAGAFENHVHGFKVTKPLRGNAVHQNGTIYFGDGAWGAITKYSEGCLNDTSLNIFEKTGKDNNGWISDVSLNSARHIAINQKGQQIYQLYQNLSNKL